MDELANGSWLGINEGGVIAAVLNRIHTLGPLPGFRSRGELTLRALDHPDARSAAGALAHLDSRAYRPFNLVVIDHREGYWLRLHSRDNEPDAAGPVVEVSPLPAGLTMVTAYDPNDLRSPRTRHYLPQFQRAAVPDPEAGEWSSWRSLLAAQEFDREAGPGGAMNVRTDTGFGTVCASLLALPAGDRTETAPIWLFAPGRPNEVPFGSVAIARRSVVTGPQPHGAKAAPAP
jgi:hypothetical protein